MKFFDLMDSIQKLMHKNASGQDKVLIIDKDSGDAYEPTGFKMGRGLNNERVNVIEIQLVE